MSDKYIRTWDNISPIDGRYSSKTWMVGKLFSEKAYLKECLRIEVSWLKKLSDSPDIPECPKVDGIFWRSMFDHIESIGDQDILKLKQIENHTGHDIKAIELYIVDCIRNTCVNGGKLEEFVHFGITSEDTTNIAYAINIAKTRILISDHIKVIRNELSKIAVELCDCVMLARTHGQPASPTTFGKEMIVYQSRLERELKNIGDIAILGKFGGATGNMNACYFAYPNVEWEEMASEFISSFDIQYEQYTTQVSSHDWLAQFFHNIIRINNILIDLCRDMWDYISRDYIILKTDRVGSSTMPHKINPIEFENAEGNLEFANSMLSFFADKLTKSRLQRDLSGSTVKRNIGVAISHCVIAYFSIRSGFEKISVNKDHIRHDLANHIEVLTEAIQTMMRKHGINNSFDKVRAASNPYNQAQISETIKNLDINNSDKKRLLNLLPSTYTGSLLNKELE